MKNKGFTLVEIISVVVILGLLAIISIPIVSNVSDNIKKKTLNTKIENIEKAAVLYGQKHRENFTKVSVDNCLNKYCTKDGSSIFNCECYKENSVSTINVAKLISEGLIKEDATVEVAGTPTKVITNSLNESNYLNECKIQIYQKYGKIYAVYDIETNKNVCFYN